MAGLQRSNETFRRSGSSGLVWEDRFLSEELKKPTTTTTNTKGEEDHQVDYRELRPTHSVGSIGMLDRNRSNGGRGYRTGRISPALDPPSPKFGGCGFCGIFGKSSGGGGAAPTNRSKPRARR